MTTRGRRSRNSLISLTMLNPLPCSACPLLVYVHGHFCQIASVLTHISRVPLPLKSSRQWQKSIPAQSSSHFLILSNSQSVHSQMPLSTPKDLSSSLRDPLSQARLIMGKFFTQDKE